MSHIAVVPRRIVATMIALAFALCVLGTYAAAQSNIQPKDEVFAGYSWLNPDGYADFGYKVKSIDKGIDVSNTWYLPSIHNLGWVVDASGHWDGNDFTSVGFLLTGLQYKYHTDTFSPFARFLVGAAALSPPYLGGPGRQTNEWKPAVGGGGGFDLNINHTFAIRIAQVDYIYTTYNPVFLTGHTTTWNNIRLAAGVVINLGNYYTIPPTCSATASPTEVWAGEPVTATATGSGFSPKHTVTYAWTATGGKIDTANAQSAHIDTTGLAPGSYTANATLNDAKIKKNGSATCAANFTIKTPHPPEVSCSANPTTIAIGQTSTITMTASSPDGRPLTYTWSSTGGQLSGSGTSATLTATAADAGNTITVTGTATDDRPLSSSCTASVTVPPVEQCKIIEDWGECTFEKNPKKPWRVDNDCKDTLDKLALRIQGMPGGKLDIVGYTNEKEVVTEKTLGAQRSVNVKYYLTTDGPTKVDASRIQPRDGGTKDQSTHFYYVPEGCLQSGQTEEGTPVDESQIQGQSRNAPAKKGAHHKKATGATGAAESTGNAVEQGAAATGNAVEKGAEATGNAVGSAAKATGHAVKKGAKKTEQAVTPQ